jgi:xylan 1,4-beta-xylosidase
MIQNPILRGFNPDPSIIRVGEDYYIATSTFEWFPGVQIHHSRDLEHWRLLTRPLDRISQLDLRGVGASQGVWAPCLTYDKGIFYLVYTVVTAFYCNMYDTHNYIVTAENILGPWSEPVEVSSFGFDPSLFHDEDGRKYMVMMVTDHRAPKKYAGRLIVQEYDPVKQKVIGDFHEVYQGKNIFLEGPHLFKRNGWYYLFCADTGTGEGHGQTMLRSRHIFGPYEMDKPDFGNRSSETEAYSILTSRHTPDHPIQKAGHADLVETQHGEWYIVHLCGRPLSQRNPADAPRFAGSRRYMLGRETAIQQVYWTENGWLRLANSTNVPDETLPAPDLPACVWPKEPERDDFNSPALRLPWQFLRVPLTERDYSLTEKSGFLRLYGGNGLGSRFKQSLIAQRLTEVNAVIETSLYYEPRYFKQMAGLILLYDNDNYLYLHVTLDEELGKVITLLKAENKKYASPFGYIPVPENNPIKLRLVLNHGNVSFSWNTNAEWHSLGPETDASFLSDEACMEGWFTGTMVGLCCQDLTGFHQPADFDYFSMRVQD